MVSLRGENNMFAEVRTSPPKNYGLNCNLLKSYVVQALAYILLLHLICRRERPHWSGLKECGNGPRNQVSHQNNQNQPTLLLCPSYVHKSHLCPSIHLLVLKIYTLGARCTLCAPCARAQPRLNFWSRSISVQMLKCRESWSWRYLGLNARWWDYEQVAFLSWITPSETDVQA